MVGSLIWPEKRLSLHTSAGPWKQEAVAIPLGIIVFQANLQFDGFSEVALLLVCRVLEEVLDVLSNVGDRDFTTHTSARNARR